jgi:hypothetical protein
MLLSQPFSLTGVWHRWSHSCSFILLQLRGLIFFWLLLRRPDWARDPLWMWREAWGIQTSDTELNSEVPARWPVTLGSD